MTRVSQASGLLPEEPETGRSGTGTAHFCVLRYGDYRRKAYVLITWTPASGPWLFCTCSGSNHSVRSVQSRIRSVRCDRLHRSRWNACAVGSTRQSNLNQKREWNPSHLWTVVHRPLVFRTGTGAGVPGSGSTDDWVVGGGVSGRRTMHRRARTCGPTG